MTSGGRIRALDGVRGLAILLVVAAHLSPSKVPLGGVAGVTLFFVLSGYLITRLLLRERVRAGRVDYRAFYLRRAVRLFPALALVLAAAPLIMWAAGDPRLEYYPATLTAVALYVGNFVRAVGGELGVLDHTWSLSVEEQFYMLWPVVLLSIVAWVRRDRLPLAVTALAAVALAWRIVAAEVLAFDRVYYAPDTNAFALLLGCALAAHETTGAVARRPRPVLLWTGATVLCGVSVAPLLVPSFPTLHAAPVAALSGLALVAAARGHDHWPFALPAAVWFGTISYSWYLWHALLMSLRIDGEDPTPTQGLIAAVVSLLVAWASWQFFERVLLERYRPGERQDALTSATPSR